MALALGLWTVVLIAYYGTSLTSTNRWFAYIREGGRFALIGAIVLYPCAAGTSVGLLNCRSVSLAAYGAASMDGGAAAAAASLASGRPVTVQVLVGNPFFVCWEPRGSHRVAAMLAALTLALYVAGLPPLTLWWASPQPARNLLCAAISAPVRCRRPNHEPEASLVFQGNPMKRPGPPLESLPVSAFPRVDPIIIALLGDYRPEAWFMKSIDLCLLLVLALLAVLMSSPVDLTGIATKASIASVALCFLCILVLWMRPFRADDAWQGWVRAMLLLDSVACAVLNALVSANDISDNRAALVGPIAGFSIVVFVCCIITFAVLIVGVSVYMYQGSLILTYI